MILGWGKAVKITSCPFVLPPSKNPVPLPPTPVAAALSALVQKPPSTSSSSFPSLSSSSSSSTLMPMVDTRRSSSSPQTIAPSPTTSAANSARDEVLGVGREGSGGSGGSGGSTQATSMSSSTSSLMSVSRAGDDSSATTASSGASVSCVRCYLTISYLTPTFFPSHSPSPARLLYVSRCCDLSFSKRQQMGLGSCRRHHRGDEGRGSTHRRQGPPEPTAAQSH